jgi:uncharacterized membrane protein YphA (DoxX/SURF4 family)
MKLIATLARILVGIEFVFSGFVKVVDPYGTGLKLQEYFEVFAADLPAFSGFFELLASQSQFLSLVFCASELILGVALLFSFRMNLTAWIVTGMMAFFTFLTFYSAYFEKVTDCGCFGDFLKLKPWHSFYKDIISLAVILIIFIYRQKYKPIAFATQAVAIASIIAFGIGLYAKRYLPVIDFLPYAKGLSLPKQMEPTGIKPVIEYTFLNKAEDKEIKSKEYLMDTVTYKYLDSEVLNEDEIRPKITDYAVTDSDGNDFTEESFNGSKLLFIFKKTDKLDQDIIIKMRALAEDLEKNRVSTMSLTSLFLEDFRVFHQANKLPGEIFNTDEKVLKTMARTNPVIIVLKNGTVIGKWSGHNIPSSAKVLDLLKN